MHDFKEGDRVQWVGAPWAQGTVGAVIETGISIDWEDDVSETYWYWGKDLKSFEHAQKPADLPKYIIVQGKAQDVVVEVEQYLKQGYKLQGGASMHQDWFAQALVLED